MVFATGVALRSVAVGSAHWENCLCTWDVSTSPQAVRTIAGMRSRQQRQSSGTLELWTILGLLECQELGATQTPSQESKVVTAKLQSQSSVSLKQRTCTDAMRQEEQGGIRSKQQCRLRGTSGHAWSNQLDLSTIFSFLPKHASTWQGMTDVRIQEEEQRETKERKPQARASWSQRVSEWPRLVLKRCFRRFQAIGEAANNLCDRAAPCIAWALPDASDESEAARIRGCFRTSSTTAADEAIPGLLAVCPGRRESSLSCPLP